MSKKKNRAQQKKSVQDNKTQNTESKSSNDKSTNSQGASNKSIYEQTAYEKKWALDSAWMTGLAGLLTTIICAIWFQQTNALAHGIRIFGEQLTRNKIDTCVGALFIVGAVMFFVELWRHLKQKRTPLFSIDPLLADKNHFSFFLHAVLVYLQYLFLFWLALYFYKTAGEYGFLRHRNGYYQPWFRLMEIFWTSYLFAGLPYILITRAYKHCTTADERDHNTLIIKLVTLVISFIPNFKHLRPDMGKSAKTAAHNLLVKLFFIPLMTVFFVDQFPHFVNNVGYIFDGLPNSLGHAQFELARLNRDLINILTNGLFTLHVALAWPAYTLTSRWIANNNISLQPALSGWLICLVCYPPFSHLLITKHFKQAHVTEHMRGLEEALYQLSGQFFITALILVIIALYTIYTLSTVFMGMHFSNLCNRGIVRKGPYAIVRHPAYASKTIAWLCTVIPFTLYHAVEGRFTLVAVLAFSTLVFVVIYICRALTEEKHLSEDPNYITYKTHVKYRFIPGVL